MHRASVGRDDVVYKSYSEDIVLDSGIWAVSAELGSTEEPDGVPTGHSLPVRWQTATSSLVVCYPEKRPDECPVAVARTTRIQLNVFASDAANCCRDGGCGILIQECGYVPGSGSQCLVSRVVRILLVAAP